MAKITKREMLFYRGYGYFPTPKFMQIEIPDRCPLRYLQKLFPRFWETSWNDRNT